ncbi:MAG: hypothetical protein ACRDQ7_28055 [Haloechinothrix sp.]
MITECAKCTSDLDHCHGTLVLHYDGLIECTEPGCRDTADLRHPLVIDCHAVEGGCACTAWSVTEELRRAS